MTLRLPVPLDVLRALVASERWSATVHVANRLRRDGFESIRTDLVLRRLRTLEGLGYVSCDGPQFRGHRFHWLITLAGKAALKAAHTEVA